MKVASGLSAGTGAGTRKGTGMTLLLAATIVLFGPVTFLLNGFLTSVRPPAKNDFTSYYVAGTAVRSGQADALYYPRPVGSLLAQASEQHPWIDIARPAGIEHPNYYLYPPLFSILFAPLTLLSYKAAWLVWALAGLACLSAATAMALRRFPRPWSSPGALFATGAVILVPALFYPVTRTFAVGQSSLLLLLLMAGALHGLSRKSRNGDMTTGLCLALGILLKLTPAIFLPWLLLRRRYRALLFCTMSVGALLAISLSATGTAPHEIYFGKMVGMLSGGTAFYPNQSLTGLALRLWGGDWRLADLVAASATPVLFARGLAVALLAVTFLVFWRRRHKVSPAERGEEREFGSLVMASLIVSPISWEHHYVLALLPAWCLLREAWEDGDRASTTRSAAVGLGLALVGSYVGLRVIGPPSDGFLPQVMASTGLIGGLILWGLLLLPRKQALPEKPLTERPQRSAVDGAGLRALLVLLTVFVGGSFMLKVAEYSRSFQFGDFTSYYVAASTLLEGRGDPLYYPGTPDMILARATTPGPWTETATRAGVKESNYYLYPPFFAMAMIPFAMIPYGWAHGLWYIANLLALGGSIMLALKIGRDGRGEAPAGSRVGEAAFAVIAVGLSWPALFTFGAGQANFIVLLCLLGGIAALQSRREIAGGLLVAGAAAIKMTPAILLPWLVWRGRWKAALAATVMLAALFVAGGGVAGWDSYSTYRTEMLPLLSRGCAHWINESPLGFFTRGLDGGNLFSWAIASPSLLSKALASVSSLLLLGGAMLALGRRGSDGGDCRLDLEVALLAVTTLFVSPLSWTHHSVLSLLGFFVAARHLAARGAVSVSMAGVYALAFLMVNVHFQPPGFLEWGPLRSFASVNLAGNLLLWAILFRLVRAGRGAVIDRESHA